MTETKPTSNELQTNAEPTTTATLEASVEAKTSTPDQAAKEVRPTVSIQEESEQKSSEHTDLPLSAETPAQQKAEESAVDAALDNKTSNQESEDTSLPSQEKDAVFHSFTQAGFNAKLLLSIHNAGWERPSEIQSKCLPHTLSGNDLVGYAQTGSGKTGVFLLTVGHHLATKAKPSNTKHTPPAPLAIILTPTRELAVQINEEAERLLGGLSINSTAVFGGANMEQQINQLSNNPQLVVGTPGRLKDLYKREEIAFSQVELFICDDADRMFDMGFIDDVKFFLDKTPNNAQRLMFSATATPKIANLIKEHLQNPVQISLNLENSLPESLTQVAYICSIENKFLILLSMLQKHNPSSALIFTNTKVVASWLQYKLDGNGMGTEVLTGDLAQHKRIKLINRIKNGDVRFLIATDVASRGIHIDGLTHVYNFDVPEDPAAYVHRIGRTGRADAAGTSYTLVCDEYGHGYDAIRNILGKDLATPIWPDWDLTDTVDNSDNPYLNPESNLYKDTVPQTFKKEEKTTEHRMRQGASQDSQRTEQAPQHRETSSHSQSKNKPLKTAAQSSISANGNEASEVKKESSTSILKIVKHFFSLLNPFKSALKEETHSKKDKPSKAPRRTDTEVKTSRSGSKRERRSPRDEQHKTSKHRSQGQSESEKRHHPGGGHRRPHHRNNRNNESTTRNKKTSTNNNYQPRRDPRGSSRPMPKKRPSKN